MKIKNNETTSFNNPTKEKLLECFNKITNNNSIAEKLYEIYKKINNIYEGDFQEKFKLIITKDEKVKFFTDIKNDFSTEEKQFCLDNIQHIETLIDIFCSQFLVAHIIATNDVGVNNNIDMMGLGSFTDNEDIIKEVFFEEIPAN